MQGTDAKIKCEVRANPVAVVEWLKDDQTISSGGRWVARGDADLERPDLTGPEASSNLGGDETVSLDGIRVGLCFTRSSWMTSGIT